MRTHPLALLVVAVLAAGCADTDEPGAAGAASAGGEPAGAEGANASGAAPRDDGAAGAAIEQDGAETPPTREVVVSEAGSFSGGAEVCQTSASGGSCSGPGGVRDGFDIDLGGGTATGFAIALSWDPETPASEVLTMSVYACSDDGCDVFDHTGPSGITSTQTGGAWTSITVSVSAQPTGAGGVSAYAAPPEEFQLEGSVTVVGP